VNQVGSAFERTAAEIEQPSRHGNIARETAICLPRGRASYFGDALGTIWGLAECDHGHGTAVPLATGPLDRPARTRRGPAAEAGLSALRGSGVRISVFAALTACPCG
jgi:hypothetical protein